LRVAAAATVLAGSPVIAVSSSHNRADATLPGHGGEHQIRLFSVCRDDRGDASAGAVIE